MGFSEDRIVSSDLQRSPSTARCSGQPGSLLYSHSFFEMIFSCDIEVSTCALQMTPGCNLLGTVD